MFLIFFHFSITLSSFRSLLLNFKLSSYFFILVEFYFLSKNINNMISTFKNVLRLDTWVVLEQISSVNVYYTD